MIQKGSDILKAYKCDRCGALYETFNGPQVVGKYVITSGETIAPMVYRNGNWKQIDLCDECMSAFLSFMKDGGNEECQ